MFGLFLQETFGYCSETKSQF